MSLKELVVTREAIAEEALCGSLKGLVSVLDGNGDIIPTSEFGALDNTLKVLAYLLAVRAAVILGYKKCGQATAEDVAAALGLDVQRTRECLSRLKPQYLDRTEEGYGVPFMRVPAACEELSKRRSK